jgi:hypothetical protein
MKFIKAIYYFFVGDVVFLVGVLITVLLLALIDTIPALNSLKAASGVILILAILLLLFVSLRRETH